MELVEGDSVAALVSGGSRLGWAEAAALCSPVASALAYAHARGVVHRDLTAANVLVEAGVRPGRRLRLRARAAAACVVRDAEILGHRRDAGVLVAGAGGRADTRHRHRHLCPRLPAVPARSRPAAVRERRPFCGGSASCSRGRRPRSPRMRRAFPRMRARSSTPCLPVTPGRVRRRSRPCASSGRKEARCRGARAPAARAARRRRRASRRRKRPPPSRRQRQRSPDRTPRGGPKSYRAVRRGRVAAAAFVFAVLVALVGGGVFAIASREPPGVAAPPLVGATLAQARERVGVLAEQNDVVPPRVLVTGRAYSERIPAGAVLAQDHSPGEHVPAKGTLGVRLSLGSPWAVVPRRRGLRPAALSTSSRRPASPRCAATARPSPLHPGTWPRPIPRPAAGSGGRRRSLSSSPPAARASPYPMSAATTAPTGSRRSKTPGSPSASRRFRRRRRTPARSSSSNRPRAHARGSGRL